MTPSYQSQAAAVRELIRIALDGGLKPKRDASELLRKQAEAAIETITVLDAKRGEAK